MDWARKDFSYTTMYHFKLNIIGKQIIGIISLFIFLSCMAHSQTIPKERKVDWSVSGLMPNTPKTNVTEAKVNSFGAKADGVSDDSQAIQKALNSLKQSGGIVLLGAGKYLLTKGISIPSNVILRGKSSTETHLLFNSGNSIVDFVNFKGQAPKSFISLKKVPEKGDTILELSNATDLKTGDWLELRQKNGSWDVNARDWAQYAVGQMVEIQRISGNKVRIKNPIRIDYDLSLQPEVGKFNPTKNAGIENLSMERMSQPENGLNFNIYFQFAVNCWVKNIEGKRSAGSHVQIEQSSNVKISGSYFHDAFDYSGSSTKGYGVVLSVHSGECLVEDNIFRNLRHSLMLKQGANGNVIAYNYSIQPKRSEFISNYSGDISLHGHYPFANLIEGNIVQNIIIDKYWGESGPDNTIFRNRVELYGIIFTSPKAGSNHNIIANETTNTGLFMGSLAIMGDNHLVKSNQIGKATSFDEKTESSLFYQSKPDFWNIPDVFPTIGEGFNTGTIPAKKRFEEED